MRRFILAAVLAIVAAPALAQDPAPAPAPPVWTFSVSPYAWAMSLHGTMKSGGAKVEISEPITEIVHDANSIFSVSGRLAAEYEPWHAGVFVDGLHDAVGADHMDLLGSSLGRVDGNFGLTVVEGGAYYQLFSQPASTSPDAADLWGAGLTVDAYAGVRWMQVGSRLHFKSIGVEQTQTEGWVDPIVGARAMVDLGGGWSLVTDHNIGGFTLGSQVAYEGTGLVQYAFPVLGQQAALWAGYRGLYEDYRGDDGFQWKVWMHGPILGGRVSF